MTHSHFRFTLNRRMAALLTVGLMGAIVGCSSSDSPSRPVAAAQTADSSASAPAETSKAKESTSAATANADTVSYTDYTGHTVQIPVNPQRIIYYGETLGDLLKLGVRPIGTSTDQLDERSFSHEIPDIEDVGSPPNPEKSLMLSPDLIITGNTDEKLIQSLSKVAPTITFDTFAKLEDRMTELGVILNKKEEAAKWIKQYEQASAKMWTELHAAGLGQDETASVFTFYPGNRLFVMAGTGLPQALYQQDGFKAPQPIQKLVDEGTGFLEISPEVLDEYAGDRIFILNAVDTEAQQSTEDLVKTAIWKKLPAVQANQVYRIDILKASSDAYTLEELLQTIPKMLEGK
ncbi:hypothetical protein B9G55_06975 [Saccharibacillus sp. O16]|nr:hypothetical protein B9G55_06975 [Saccharibacillus sp. O16]